MEGCFLPFVHQQRHKELKTLLERLGTMLSKIDKDLKVSLGVNSNYFPKNEKMVVQQPVLLGFRHQRLDAPTRTPTRKCQQ